MKTTKNLAALVALLTFLVIGNQAFAQNETTTTTAEGTVLEPISLSSTVLKFGSEIFPGNVESVASTATDAAQFDISGEAGKTVNTSFNLPENLTNSSDTELPITFSSTDAGHASAEADQDAQTEFDPGTDQSLTLDETSGELYIWLGGTVEPTTDQEQGDYSGDITLDVTYPSN